MASAKPSGAGGSQVCTYALAMTRTGRSRLEHRHGWLDAVMAECPCSHGWREGTGLFLTDQTASFTSCTSLILLSRDFSMTLTLVILYPITSITSKLNPSK